MSPSRKRLQYVDVPYRGVDVRVGDLTVPLLGLLPDLKCQSSLLGPPVLLIADVSPREEGRGGRTGVD